MVPALTTGFVPKVVSSTVGGRSKVREQGNVVRLWLVAWRRSGFAALADPRTVVHGAGFVDNPDLSSRVPALDAGLLGAQYFFTFLSRFRSPYLVPYCLVPRPMFVPKRRSQQGVVGSRAVMTLSLLLETPPFIGPKLLSLDNYISRDQSYMHFQH